MTQDTGQLNLKHVFTFLSLIAAIGGVFAVFDRWVSTPKVEMTALRTQVDFNTKEISRLNQLVVEKTDSIKDSITSIDAKLNELRERYERDKIILDNTLSGLDTKTDPGDSEILRIFQERITTIVTRLRDVQKELSDLNARLDKLEKEKR